MCEKSMCERFSIFHRFEPRYDEIEESESGVEKIAIQKLLYLISFWYIGRAASQDEFEKLLGMVQKEEKTKE